MGGVLDGRSGDFKPSSAFVNSSSFVASAALVEV